MTVELQRCSDCNWTESGRDRVNPNRKQCPSCGAAFYESYKVQWFGGHGPEGA